MPAVYDWRYVDLSNAWTPMPVTNPAKSFFVRGVKDGVTVQKVVFVCGDTIYLTVGFDVVDTPDETGYLPKILGIPEGDIIDVTWTVKEYTTEDLVETTVTAPTEIKYVDDLRKVCASAVVTIACGCDPITLEEICYEFTQRSVDCVTNTADVDFVIEDGTYKAIRIGVVNCCIALDHLMYKINEDDPWQILQINETIYADEIWFQRVVVFTGGVCGTIVKEIKAK